MPSSGCSTAIDMAAHESIGPWARKAEALYDDELRAHAIAIATTRCSQKSTYQNLIDWLRQVCDRFHHPIDVLDLGCGTGRYFWGCDNVRSLVGLDASAPMLAEARQPIHADRITARAHHARARRSGDARVSGRQFRSRLFDRRARRARAARCRRSSIACWRWLKPGGRFAFTTVHPQSPSVPQDAAARLARRLLPIVPGVVGRRAASPVDRRRDVRR